MRSRLADLPATYQELFLSGRFPEGGTFFPAQVSPLADTAFAVLVGGPLIALALAPVWWLRRDGAAAASWRRLLDGDAPSLASLGTLGVLVPVLFICMIAGLLAAANAAAAWREARARRLGRCHFGLWMDAEALVVRLPGPFGGGLVAHLPRAAVRDARLERMRTRDAVIHEPVVHYQKDEGLGALTLPASAFGPATSTVVLESIRLWAGPSPGGREAA